MNERMRIASFFLLGAVLGAAEFTSAPSVSLNPNAAAPLVAIVRFTASVPVETTITVSDTPRAWEVKFGKEQDPSKGLPVFGLRPGRKHSFQVTIRDQFGATWAPQMLEMV